MSVFGRRRRPAGADLAARVDALQRVLDVGGDRLDTEVAARGHQLIGKVSTRLRIAGEHTVAALAGATGSGKSSLFNALCGAPVSQVGVRRPTTSTATAATWDAGGDGSATELLDWLAVPNRHVVPGEAAGGLDGLVLLDLPDHDSTQTAHRAESDRLIGLVDVFVWVTDPQKYADAALHRRYLAPLAGHDAVTIVVLNQADRLTPEQTAETTADLTRLLRADGLAAVEVLATSVTTGQGIAELRTRLAAAVGRRSAAVERLAADLSAIATDLTPSVGDARADPTRVGRDSGLGAALADAAGVPTVLAAVEAGYRRDATGSVGWPFTRWLRRFKPDPLRRLRIGGVTGAAVRAGAGVGKAMSRADGRPGRSVDAQQPDGKSPGEPSATVARTSLPPASPAALTRLDLATRRVGDAAAAGLPPRWAAAADAAARPGQDDLIDGLDRVVGSADLTVRKPVWWRVIGVIQWLLAAAAMAGMVWLIVLAVLGWLQVPPPDTPFLGPLPWPTVLLAGGAVLGLALALVLRPVIAVGARRRRDRVARQLDHALGELADQRILGPVQRVLAAHHTVQQALAVVAGER